MVDLKSILKNLEAIKEIEGKINDTLKNSDFKEEVKVFNELIKRLRFVKKAFTSDKLKKLDQKNWLKDNQEDFIKRLNVYGNNVIQQIDIVAKGLDTYYKSKNKNGKESKKELIKEITTVNSNLAELESKEIKASLKEESDNMSNAARMTNLKDVYSKGGAIGILNFVEFSNGYTFSSDFNTPFDKATYKWEKARVMVIFVGMSDKFQMSYNQSSKLFDTIFQHFLQNNKKDIFINAIIIPMVNYLKNNQKINLSDTELNNIIIQLDSGDSDRETALKFILGKINDSKDVSAWEKFKNELTQINKLEQIKFNDDYLDKNIFSKNILAAVNHAATTLSGTLLLAESFKRRNPTFGKLERDAIKNVLSLAEKNYSNPFGKVFNSENGRFIPAANAKDSYNKEVLELATPMFQSRMGGVAQCNMVLNFKIDGNGEPQIKLDDLPDAFKDLDRLVKSIKDKTLDETFKFIKPMGNPNDERATKESALIDYVDRLDLNKLDPKKNFGKSETVINTLTLAVIVKQFIESGLNRQQFIDLSTLPDDDKFKFPFNNDGSSQTMKEFFTEQFEKNSRKLYKLKNRTTPSKK